MEAKVLGIGNALVDILVRIPNDGLLNQFNLPRGGMKLIDTERFAEVYGAIKNFEPTIVSGGSVSNTVSALANLGIQSTMVGKVGRNELGRFFRTDLERAGVEVNLYESDTVTGSCLSLITPDSQRTMATCLGAAVELSTFDINPSVFDRYTHFYTEGYLVQDHVLIETILSIAHSHGLVTCFDMASYNVVEENHDFMQDLIRKYVDVVFANEEEAMAFTGKEDIEALNEIGELSDIVVLKMGCKGSLVKYHDHVERVGVFTADSIDTTGAGDLYAAGFLYGMINELTPEKCAMAGAVTSSNVIEVIGTKMDAHRWSRIRQQLQRL